MILLNDLEAAMLALPGALVRGDVTRENLRTWPLFDRLRGMPEFDRLVASEDEDRHDGDRRRGRNALGPARRAGGRGSRRDGFREQIISGQTGRLYAPATPGALTAALAAALDLGPAQRSRMREAACRRVIAMRDVIRNLAETLRTHFEAAPGHEIVVAFDAEDAAAARQASDPAYEAGRAHADHAPIKSLGLVKQGLDTAGIPLGRDQWRRRRRPPRHPGPAASASRAITCYSGDRDLSRSSPARSPS